MFLTIHKDLFFRIVSHVDNVSVFLLREVCRQFHDLCKQSIVWLDRAEQRLGYIPEHDNTMILFQRSLRAGRPRAWYDRQLSIHPELENRRDIVRVSATRFCYTIWATVVTIDGECYLANDKECVCIASNVLDSYILFCFGSIRLAVLTTQGLLYIANGIDTDGGTPVITPKQVSFTDVVEVEGAREIWSCSTDGLRDHDIYVLTDNCVKCVSFQRGWPMSNYVLEKDTVTEELPKHQLSFRYDEVVMINDNGILVVGETPIDCNVLWLRSGPSGYVCYVVEPY